MGEGCYFGDEEGLEPKIKMFYAKVTSLNTMLFVISKSKIKLNITQNDNVHRWRNMCIASKHRSNLLMNNINQMKNVIRGIRRGDIHTEESNDGTKIVDMNNSKDELPVEIPQLEAMLGYQQESQNDEQLLQKAKEEKYDNELKKDENDNQEIKILHNALSIKLAKFLEFHKKKLNSHHNDNNEQDYHVQNGNASQLTQVSENTSLLSKYQKATILDRTLEGKIEEAKKIGKKHKMKTSLPNEARREFMDIGYGRLQSFHKRIMSERKNNYSMFVTEVSANLDEVLSSYGTKSEKITDSNKEYSSDMPGSRFTRVRRGHAYKKNKKEIETRAGDAVVVITRKLNLDSVEGGCLSLSVDGSTAHSHIISNRTRKPPTKSMILENKLPHLSIVDTCNSVILKTQHHKKRDNI